MKIALNLTIYLMKKNSKLSLESYLKEEYRNDKDNLSKHYVDKDHLINSGDTSGLIYIYKEKRPIAWADTINKLAKTKKKIAPKNIENIKAVVLLKVDVQVFALSFSNGISLIKNNRIEKEFGLVTNRKLINQKNLKSIKTVSLDTEIISNHKRAKKQIPYHLQLNDSSLSIVNNVSGPVAHEIIDIEDMKLTVSGQNQIQLRVNQHPNFLAHILTILRKLLIVYEDESYKDKFQWKHEIIKVRDPNSINKLDEKLAEKIRMMMRAVKNESSGGINQVSRNTLKNIELHADPPYLEDNPVYGFKITGLPTSSKKILKELDEINLFSNLALLLNQRVDQPEDLESTEIISKLKTNDVSYYLFNDINTPIYLSKMYSIIYFETAMPNKTKYKYILFQGNWYEIPKTYLSYLEKEINSIPNNTLGIEYMDFTNEHSKEKKEEIKDKAGNVLKDKDGEIKTKIKTSKSEEEYNKAMSEKFKTENLILFDQKNYQITKRETDNYNLNPNSKVEPCDLFQETEDTIQLIHVKIGKSGSGLSHLLSQSYISSMLYKYEKSFKKHINQELKRETIQDDTNKKIVVVLACIVNPKEINKKNSEVFPLLAAANIVRNVNEIKKLGFDCHLIKIPNKYKAN